MYVAQQFQVNRKLSLPGKRIVLQSVWQKLRVALCFVVAAFVSLSAPTCLASAPADSAHNEPSLARLEIKFFQHEYPKDTVEKRLERLEKMVFGEAREGSKYERLSSLISAVPNLNGPAEDSSSKERQDRETAQSGESGQPMTSQNAVSPNQEEPTPLSPQDASKYPAVTAIEIRLLGRDYTGEPVKKRLDRLETKLFGKPSTIGDLSDRVDHIKQATGVDIARIAPPGSDWAEEEEDGNDLNALPSTARSGEDGRSFSGRDLRQDMQRAYGMPPESHGNLSDRFSASGTYGMGDLRNPLANGGNISPPPIAPPRRPPNSVNQMPPAAPPLGLNQQVGALEMEIFGRTFTKDALPSRLSHLESTIFPQEKPASEKPLPERVRRLISVIPLSGNGKRIAQMQQPNLNEDQLADPNGVDVNANQPGQAQVRGGGLSKIINSIGNFLSGGFNGGYPMYGSQLTTDPRTGLLYDSSSGNLIDPNTGVVVGQRMGSNMGMGGFGSFSSGFSPFGSMPYGMGSVGGMGFGIGGIGRSGFGMWP